MQQIDLHLRGAGLMDQRVDLDVLCLAEGVHVVEQWIELVHRRDAVGLPADFRTPRAAHRGLERVIRVDVRLDQEELELGRHHRLPAVSLVQLEHPPQHVARRHGHRPAVAVEAIVDDLRRRLGRPRHDPHGLRIGLEHDVDV